MITETTTAELKTDVPMMQFYDNVGKEIGRLDNIDGVLTFEGDADESAKILFDTLLRYISGYLEEKYGAKVPVK